MFNVQQQRSLELKVQALHAEIKRHDIPYSVTSFRQMENNI